MRLYRLSDSGEPVRDIQGRLSALGFECGADVVGDFGEGTYAAVIAFQRSRNLGADGIVGPETWRSLVEAGHRLGGRLLYHRLPMLRGDDVADLQRRLNALGFDAGKVDGIFGPDTLRALLDFQSNRNMAEDGVAGPAVARELDLVHRATEKAGREGVREREWLRALPPTVAGHRVLLDPFCRDEAEDAASWSAATAAARAFQDLGAYPFISRSADTRTSERIRAHRANRMGADLVVAFALPREEPPCVFFFASAHGRSEIGALLARSIAASLGVPERGLTCPILKETRPPAVVVAMTELGPETGRTVATAVEGFFKSQRDEAAQAG